MTTLLELKQLEVAYGGIHAVKGVNLKVEEGELVCLIGANGAGKTTTLKAICGLLPVKAGHVEYAGAQRLGHGTGGTRCVRHAHHRRKPGDGRVYPRRQGGGQARSGKCVQPV